VSASDMPFQYMSEHSLMSKTPSALIVVQ